MKMIGQSTQLPDGTSSTTEFSNYTGLGQAQKQITTWQQKEESHKIVTIKDNMTVTQVYFDQPQQAAISGTRTITQDGKSEVSSRTVAKEGYDANGVVSSISGQQGSKGKTVARTYVTTPQGQILETVEYWKHEDSSYYRKELSTLTMISPNGIAGVIIKQLAERTI